MASFDQTEELNKTSQLAQHYGVTFQAATKIQSAMNGAVFANSIRMVAQMIVDFRSQAADSNSAVWKSCTASGSWKTPENSSCKSAEWAGCSLQTGASLCTAN